MIANAQNLSILVLGLMASEATMTSDERRLHLSNFLAERGFANLSALAEELDVSESTVRRDLSQLEDEGIARRTHGGAVFVSDRFSVLNYAVRESTAAAEKAAIGQATAGLIEDGETILLDKREADILKKALNRHIELSADGKVQTPLGGPIHEEAICRVFGMTEVG